MTSGPSFAEDKIRLMYLETELEVRAAVLAQRLGLPLEVHRIGIFRVGHELYGTIRFAAFHQPDRLATRADVAANTSQLCDRIFGEIPELVQLDIEGVSLRETKTEKPEVLFSCTVDRRVWKEVPKLAPPLERIALTGQIFFDERLPKAKSKRAGTGTRR